MLFILSLLILVNAYCPSGIVNLRYNFDCTDSIIINTTMEINRCYTQILSCDATLCTNNFEECCANQDIMDCYNCLGCTNYVARSFRVVNGNNLQSISSGTTVPNGFLQVYDSNDCSGTDISGLVDETCTSNFPYICGKVRTGDFSDVISKSGCHELTSAADTLSIMF